MDIEEIKSLLDSILSDDLNSNDPEVCKYDCLNKDILDNDYRSFINNVGQKKFKNAFENLSELQDVIFSNNLDKQKLLFILGNGFDLFHGLKSKYSDFRNYLNEKAKKDSDVKIFIRDFQSEFQSSDTDSLWNNFENSLCHIKLAETSLSISKNEVNDRINKVCKVQKDASKYLLQWLNDEVKNQSINKSGALSAILSNYKDNLDDLFVLNFNYTDTILYYLDEKYPNSNPVTILDNRYLSIHGCSYRNTVYEDIQIILKDFDNPSSSTFILGTRADNEYKSHKLTFGPNVSSSSFKRILLKIIDHLNSSEKNQIKEEIENIKNKLSALLFSKNHASTQILRDGTNNQNFSSFKEKIAEFPTKVIIFGHSLDATDFARFYYIREFLKRNELYISYYDESSIENIHKFLFAMGITDYSKVSIFCTKEE